jgi:GTP-binding protein
VLTLGDRDIILADIPGLIEGASGGAGLGIRFLKHISRTAALAFLIDLSDDTYVDAFDILHRELGAFSPELVHKPRILVGTKTDVEDLAENSPAERLAILRLRYPEEIVMGISVFSGEGLNELATSLGKLAGGNDRAHGWGTEKSETADVENYLEA